MHRHQPTNPKPIENPVERIVIVCVSCHNGIPALELFIFVANFLTPGAYTVAIIRIIVVRADKCHIRIQIGTHIPVIPVIHRGT